MSLKEELKLNRPIKLLGHETLMSIYMTAACLRRRADEFFRQYSLTDVQFNLMMLLKYQADSPSGLTQTDLSRMMLVNRANTTSLIDRMEKAALVKRTSAPDDRRCNVIKLTAKARKLLEKIEPRYVEQIGQLVGSLSKADQKQIIKTLETVRGNTSQPAT